MNLDDKLELLKKTLAEMHSVAVAFSGGVDSTFLAYIAHQTLGSRTLAITARSETYPDHEFEQAGELARQIGVRHLVVDTSELAVDSFCQNPPDRCYYCKTALFSELKQIAEKEDFRWVADGTNADDTGDFRPGMRAAEELGVRSPLLEAGLTKQDIRELSRRFDLPTWDKPSRACLASRFPYGEEISAPKLAQVGEAEEVLRGLGFKQYRVRHHGDIARIEVPPDELPRLLEMRNAIVPALRQLGFRYVAADLEGYRTGSMNEVLPGDASR